MIDKGYPMTVNFEFWFFCTSQILILCSVAFCYDAKILKVSSIQNAAFEYIPKYSLAKMKCQFHPNDP